MTALDTVLDRIVEVRPGVVGIALVNVPNTLQVFETHFPRFPVLPGVLLLERIAEVAKLVAPQHLRNQQAIRGARFRHYIEPGDQIRITVDAIAVGPDFFDCRAVAEVDGRAAVTVRTLRFDRGTGESND